MLDFLPTWVKALCGTGLMLFILIAGVSLTSKKGNKDSKTSGSGGDTKN